METNQGCARSVISSAIILYSELNVTAGQYYFLLWKYHMGSKAHAVALMVSDKDAYTANELKGITVWQRRRSLICEMMYHSNSEQ